MSTKRRPDHPLRTGWTTGACATAAVKAAFSALHGRGFPDPVTITLPRGERPSFALVEPVLEAGRASVAVIKDAGDDPDVTHGALIRAIVSKAERGIEFVAGEGVGIVTKPGLPIAVGEPAINPVPREMMRAVVSELAAEFGVQAAARIEIAIPGGAELALKTWNPRLGIEGGLSVLGTTGIVRPFSCAAWIASIHRGIDVARADHLTHVVGATGNRSEQAARAHLPDLPPHAFLDMGDFIGGMLKYLRVHPIPKLTIAGGFAKMTKFAQGANDLHSARSQIDFQKLAGLAGDLGFDAGKLEEANTAMQVLDLTGPAIAMAIARCARERAAAQVEGIDVRILITDRKGRIVGACPKIC